MSLRIYLCILLLIFAQPSSLAEGTANAETICRDKKTRVKVIDGKLSDTDKKDLEKRYEKACAHSNHTMSIEQEGNDVYVVCKCG